MRKLTLKTKLGFGDRSDSTIQDLLTDGMYEYLLYVYFGLSNIDFNDELKKVLYISTKNTISKPGKLVDVQKDNMVKRIMEKIKSNLPNAENILYVKKPNGLDKRSRVARNIRECNKTINMNMIRKGAS